MTVSEFLTKKPLAKGDLCGEWLQKGVSFDDENNAGKIAAEKLTWMRNRVKRAVKAKEIAIPASAQCFFMRGKVPFAKVGETMVVRNGKDTILTVVCGGGEFKVLGKDAVKDVCAAPAKRSRSKHQKDVADDPAEVQAATPLELRHGWTNYALQEKLNAEACAASEKYWAAHAK